MRVLFIGCVESSYRLLERLIIEKIEVVGVLTKEKSLFNSDYRDLRPLCCKASIPCHFIEDVNDDESIRVIQTMRPDLGLCFGWSQLLKENVIRMFPKGVVGFHPAALPKNRGRHPLIWALVLGMEETASTFFFINSGADEGDIISQRFIPISYDDDAQTLYDKVLSVAVKQEIEVIDAIKKETINITRQDIKQGNSWRKREKADGIIDWRMSSRGIYNLVRGLTRPYVGACFEYKGYTYSVWKCEEIKVYGYENYEPGKVIAVDSDGSMDVKVGEGGIRLIDYDKIDINVGEYIL